MITVLLTISGFILFLFLLWKYPFWRTATSITVFLLLLSAVVGLLADSTFYKTYVEPQSTVLSDFDDTDFLTSKRAYKTEDRIVIVNIGNQNREEIANQIEWISKYRPKVIALDVLFPYNKDSAMDARLARAIERAGNVVMVSSLGSRTEQGFGSVNTSIPEFSRFATHGYSTFPTQPGLNEVSRLCRSLYPQVVVNGKRELAFATAVAMAYDSSRTKEFLERGQAEELINYSYNLYDSDSTNQPIRVLDFDLSDIPDSVAMSFKDKIVLFGFLGEYIGAESLSDMFFTPLNKKPGGTRNPDMFGIIVHANIISMILDRHYISAPSPWLTNILNFLLCLLHISLLLFVRDRWPRGFDLIATVIIIGQIAGLTYMRMQLFEHYNLKLFFGVSVATLAIAGIAINIYLELIPYLGQKLRLSKGPQTSSN